jgi:hypothetical protein
LLTFSCSTEQEVKPIAPLTKKQQDSIRFEKLQDSLSIVGLKTAAKHIGSPNFETENTALTTFRLVATSNYLNLAAEVFLVEVLDDSLRLVIDHLWLCSFYPDTVHWEKKFAFKNEFLGITRNLCCLKSDTIIFKGIAAKNIRERLLSLSLSNFPKKTMRRDAKMTHKESYLLELKQQEKYWMLYRNQEYVVEDEIIATIELLRHFADKTE